MTAAAARTGTALRDAARELRGGWRGRHVVVLRVARACRAVPAAEPGWVHVDALASGFYLALAATGLWLAVGLAGLPSLGQGAFMAIGAVTVALLTARAGWPVLPAVVVGVAAAVLGGIVTGAGVIRLRPAFVAVTTWILTWATALLVAAFPSLLGGSRGVVVPQALSVTAHYELALVLLVTAVLAATAVAGGAVGIELRAARQRPAAAAALGVPTARRRLGAFVAAAAVAGLAGGLPSSSRRRRRRRLRALPLVSPARRGRHRRRRLRARPDRRDRRARGGDRRRRRARHARGRRDGAVRADARRRAPARRARARRRGNRPRAPPPGLAPGPPARARPAGRRRRCSDGRARARRCSSPTA